MNTTTERPTRKQVRSVRMDSHSNSEAGKRSSSGRAERSFSSFMWAVEERVHARAQILGIYSVFIDGFFSRQQATDAGNPATHPRAQRGCPRRQWSWAARVRAPRSRHWTRCTLCTKMPPRQQQTPPPLSASLRVASQTETRSHRRSLCLLLLLLLLSLLHCPSQASQ
jgi:hypothetical protein